MSYPVVDRVLPSVDKCHDTPRERIAAAFRRAVEFSRSPAKELARALNRSPKGAELLLRGDSAPSLETLVAACRTYDPVWEAFREACGRADTVSDAERLVAEITEAIKARRG